MELVILCLWIAIAVTCCASALGRIATSLHRISESLGSSRPAEVK